MKKKVVELRMIAYTEILNVYNRKNKIRLRLSDQLAEELETLEFDRSAMFTEVLRYQQLAVRGVALRRKDCNPF
ncbi:hypothetical protein J5I95_24425 [Candidatus Poribacteria bacterium]|nr:hypothetical protein [Candidatus Poribacteria bacterium]